MAHFKRPQCSDPSLSGEKRTWNGRGGQLILCLERGPLRCSTRANLRAWPALLGGLAAKPIVVEDGSTLL